MLKIVIVFVIGLSLSAGNVEAQNTQKWLTEAEELIAGQQYKSALLLLQRIEKKDEGIAAVYYQQAVCLYYLNQQKQAIDAIVKAIQLRNDRADYFAFKAKLGFEVGDDEGGLEAISKALLLDSNCVEAYLYRAQHFHKNNEFQKALIDYQVLNRYVKGDDGLYYGLASCYQSLGKYQKAIKFYQKVVEINVNDYTSYWNLALCYYSASSYDSCLVTVNNLLKYKPLDLDFALLKSDALLALGQFDKALAWQQHLVKVHPQSAEVLTSLALSYQRSYDYQNAIFIYDKLLISNFSSSWIHFQKAKCLFLAKKEEEARKSLNLAIMNRNPEDTLAQHLVYTVAALDAVFQGDTSKAIKQLKGLKLPQNSAALLAYNTLVLQESVHLPKPRLSYDSFDRAAKTNKWFIEGLNSWHTGDKEQAKAKWMKAGNLREAQLIEFFLAEWLLVKLF